MSGYSTFKIDNDYVHVMKKDDHRRVLGITEYPVPEPEEDPEIREGLSEPSWAWEYFDGHGDDGGGEPSPLERRRT